MQLISFAMTTPALLAGRKTVTRRDWAPVHRVRFHAGDLVQAWDKLPRNRGVRIATIRLTAEPVVEPLSAMPDDDYEAEGFGYLDERLAVADVPERAKIRAAFVLRSTETLADRFAADRASGREMTVVRFELVSVTYAGSAMLAAVRP